jgi:deoxyribonuclease V
MIPHPWNVTPHEAVAIQRELAGQVDFETPLDLATVKIVGAIDVIADADISTAAVVALRFPDMTLIETVRARMPTPFPYIPGLLTFREAPAVLDALASLKASPDVFLVDGMGRIHPRRMGIATHLGLWIDKPTVGVGKTHFLGDYAPPGEARGEWSPLTHRGELLGAVLRTRAKVKPVYVSPGHRIDLHSALALVMACTSRYRLPDPIRAAHNAAGAIE